MNTYMHTNLHLYTPMHIGLLTLNIYIIILIGHDLDKFSRRHSVSRQTLRAHNGCRRVRFHKRTSLMSFSLLLQ